MTGNLNIIKTNSSAATINLVSNAATAGETYSSDKPLCYLYLKDSEETVVGHIRGAVLSNDRVSNEITSMRNVNGSAVYNTLSLRIGADGTRSIGLSEAAPWLSALGLNNLLQSKQYTYTYTVAASNRLDITVSNFNISTPSGYTPFGFSYINTGSQYVFPVTISPNATASGSNILTLKNTTTSTITGTATIRVLYIKTSFYGALN